MSAWQMVYGEMEKQHGVVLVERALSYLYTAREGLIWQELYDLLSLDDDVLDDVYKPSKPNYYPTTWENWWSPALTTKCRRTNFVI
jgi:hypothetical protein